MRRNNECQWRCVANIADAPECYTTMYDTDPLEDGEVSLLTANHHFFFMSTLFHEVCREASL